MSHELHSDAGSVYSLQSGNGRESRTPTVYDYPEVREDRIVSALSGKDPFLVDFDEGDKMNPLNWSMAKRWYLTFLGGMLVLNACVLASSAVIDKS